MGSPAYTRVDPDDLCARRRPIGRVRTGIRNQPTETAVTATTRDTIARETGGKGLVKATIINAPARTSSDRKNLTETRAIRRRGSARVWW